MNPLIKLYWRFVMSGLTMAYQGNELTLLNVGYASTGDLDGLLHLGEADRSKLDKFRLHLYHKIVLENGKIKSMEGKTMLETGCGRGGGLSYLAEKLKPQYAIGVDMTESQLEYCRRTWSEKLNFLQGDAEHLSQVVPKATIDYLVDIESSFFYPDKTAFLREVREVLKEDGTFYYGTLLPYWKVNQMHNLLGRWFQVEHEEDITANVVRSLKLDTKATSDFIDAHYPFGFRWFLKQSWGLEGTLVHYLIANRYLQYKTFVLKKKEVLAK